MGLTKSIARAKPGLPAACPTRVIDGINRAMSRPTAELFEVDAAISAAGLLRALTLRSFELGAPSERWVPGCPVLARLLLSLHKQLRRGDSPVKEERGERHEHRSLGSIS
jgi:hypothetical protein